MIPERNASFQKSIDKEAVRRSRELFTVNLRKQQRREVQEGRRYSRLAQLEVSSPLLDILDAGSLEAKLMEIYSTLTASSLPGPEQLKCLQSIRNFLILSEHLPVSFLVQNQFIPLFCTYLSCDSCFSEAATIILFNLAAEDTTLAAYTVETNAIDIALSLMGSKLSTNLLWCIGCVSESSLEYRKRLLDKGFLEKIIEVINYSDESSLNLIKIGMWTVYMILKDNDRVYMEIANKLLSLISATMSLMDNQITYDSLRIVYCLTSYCGQDSINLFLSSGHLGQVLVYISTEKLKLCLYALKIIANLVAGEENSTQIVLNSHILDRLDAILPSNENKIDKEVFQCLSNITAGNSSQKRSFIEHPIRFKAFEGLHHLCLSIRLEASWIFFHLNYSHNYIDIAQLAQDGLMQHLAIAFLANEGDEKVVGNLLAISHEFLRSDNTGYITQAFCESGCLDNMESISLNPINEQHRQTIISQFFDYNS